MTQLAGIERDTSHQIVYIDSLTKYSGLKFTPLITDGRQNQTYLAPGNMQQSIRRTYRVYYDIKIYSHRFRQAHQIPPQ